MKLIILVTLIAVCASASLDEAFDKDIELLQQKPEFNRRTAPEMPFSTFHPRFRSTLGSDGFVVLKGLKFYGIIM